MCVYVCMRVCKCDARSHALLKVLGAALPREADAAGAGRFRVVRLDVRHQPFQLHRLSAVRAGHCARAAVALVARQPVQPVPWVICKQRSGQQGGQSECKCTERVEVIACKCGQRDS